MKNLFKVFAVLVFTLAVVSLVGCKKKNQNQPEEPKEVAATGYGLVHKDYVGVAEIKVKEGKVTALKFEEVYLPSHWAGVDATAVAEDLYVTYTTSKGKEATVAKYIVIDGKLFTATPVEKDVKYSSTDIADLKAWIQEAEANAKWYAEAVMGGKAFAANADSSKAAFQVTADKEGGFIKSTTGYWPQGEKYALGWKGNMAALEEALVGTSMGFADADLVKDAESKLWSFKGAVTKATLTDAKDYVAVAQRAYDTATK